MSFKEQERALFDLLFDKKLREDFCIDQGSALSAYELNESELLDFAEIRPEALKFDAKLRADLLLSQICQIFPITFSVVSSLENGLEILKQLINTQTMRTAPTERATLMGKILREQLTEFTYDTPAEKPLIIAILEAELGMAWTAATLKRFVLEGGTTEENNSSVPENWMNRPIKLASYVSASVLPQPYTSLKSQICSHPTGKLWNHISRNPVSKSLRQKIFQKEDPMLLVARAMVSHPSRCAPTVEHKTVELIEGFAHLFQHVNGSMSVEQILAELKQAGAPEQIIQSVQNGFFQLLENEMLETI